MKEKIVKNDKTYLTHVENIAFKSAVDSNRVSFFRVSNCEVCRASIPKDTIKKYCSKKCFLEAGNVEPEDQITPSGQEDDEW